jgi:hypothetical protein
MLVRAGGFGFMSFDSSSLIRNMRAMRIYAHQILEGLTVQQLMTVPKGAANSILWNMGHVCTDQVNMLYAPSGLPSPLPDDFHTWFDPGTSPADWTKEPPLPEVLAASRELNTKVVKDFEGRRFRDFTPYSITEGYSIDSIEEAIAYHTIHEGMHIGVILTLRRFVTA